MAGTNVRFEAKAGHVPVRLETPPVGDGERDDALLDQLERRHAKLNRDLLGPSEEDWGVSDMTAI